MKTICNPEEEKYQRFVKEQEACRTDVQHAFGVLHYCWAIVWHTAKTYSVEQMWELITACVIMHT
jgi:hypothetical protein